MMNRLPRSCAVLAAVLVIGAIVLVLRASSGQVSWQTWATAVACVAFIAALIVSLWWYDQWRSRR